MNQLTDKELLALRESCVTFYADGVPLAQKPYQREDHTSAVRKLESVNALAQLGARVVEILREYDARIDYPGKWEQFADAVEAAARRLGLLGSREGSEK